KNNFLKRLAEKAKPTPCHLPFDKDLPGWVEGRARRLGKTMDHGASAVLIERVDKDAGSISSAIEQLTLYTHPETRITLKDVETLLGRSVQADVFGLLDALLEAKVKTALAVLDALLKTGAKIYEVTGAFARQLEQLGKIHALTTEGFPKDAIAAEMGLPPFFAGKIFQQAERISRTRLKKMATQLLDCDAAVKTGQLGERLALERFILTSCA
ncbi:MAG: DNA polymerase III subunit delta, partial [Candidatus Omnitrophica bacterium CG07_land_8_20_14_0_80_50_8]